MSRPNGAAGDGGDRLRRQLEGLFTDESLRFDPHLSKAFDEHGYCDAQHVAQHSKVLPLLGGGHARPEVVAECAKQSHVLETLARDGRVLVRRRHPYSAADLRGHKGRGGHEVSQGIKDMPDGKNFRLEPAAVAVAPGHKTAQGKKGDADTEALKEKRRIKQERKRLQAEREEVNRKKRARENGEPVPEERPLKAVKTQEDEGEDGSKKQTRKEKKLEKSEAEKDKASFRHKINLCCKDSNFEKAMVHFDEMRAAGHAADVQIYTQLVNMAANNGATHWEKGEGLIREIREGGLTLTEGIFSGMIKLCCEAKNVEQGVAILRDMKAANCARKRRTYAPLFAGFAEQGGLKSAIEVFEDAAEQKCDLMEEDFVGMASVCAAEGDHERVYEVLEGMSELIYALQDESVAAMQSVFEKAGRSAATVAIDSAVGKCPHCAEAMQSIDLEHAELEEMCAQIDSLSRVGEKQASAFDAFKSWLQRRGAPDVVIDGANVGYFNLRPDQGDTLSYAQINKVVSWFTSRNMKPLLVMHCRHFSDNVRMSDADRRCVAQWRESKVLYSTPARMNDDWFWLYAGVWSTKVKGSAQMYMVSNDQMRDHHFQMLSTRKFLKWRERHWVNFNFADKSYRCEPTFAFPSKFSVRMQRTKKEKWHFPSATEAGKWLCCAKDSE